MVPYLASIAYYEARLLGGELLPKKGRWNRCSLSPGEMLTIPVEGGIGIVKHGNPEEWFADDSRQWRHQHLGAINARYSRTPFYRHYAPDILDIIADTGINRVADINSAIDRLVTEALGIDTFVSEIDSADAATLSRLIAYADHICPLPEGGVSMAASLFRFGPDAIFPAIRALLLNKTQTQ